MRKVLWASLLAVSLFTIGGRLALASDCTATMCANCNALDSGPVTCKFVPQSASCTCTVSFFGGTAQCAVDGVCQLSDGGGGGGGGGVGGGGSCVRNPADWCPAECSSCTTVYWN